MTRTPLDVLCILSTTLIALNAGFFYTWSFTVLQSLNLIDPQYSVSAMQTINANIRHGWFAAIFFGAPALLGLSGILLLSSSRTSGALFLLASILATATVVITLTLHIPLNNDLAGVAISNANDTLWSAYSDRWLSFNHIRMLTSVLALISAIVGIYFLRRTGLVRP